MLFVEEMFVRKIPQAFFDYYIPLLKVWKKIEPSIPKGADIEEVHNFITENVFRSTQPHVVLRKEDFRNRRDTFYALHKDSYGNYCFSTNLDVIIKETQTADLLQFDTEPESTYTGPTYFIYGTKSYFHV
ncbi:hypothetical protein NPIL_282921 [Nephila pilipes]|uniref:Uncharacterized protein n=1 Tax=Nephila pilipes TaxID=299642 RepID=A0A8X6TKG8_NEPPI|nr:hypothetical protein NPIL_282921 [Nephila pilipes]